MQYFNCQIYWCQPTNDHRIPDLYSWVHDDNESHLGGEPGRWSTIVEVSGYK